MKKERERARVLSKTHFNDIYPFIFFILIIFLNPYLYEIIIFLYIEASLIFAISKTHQFKKNEGGWAFSKKISLICLMCQNIYKNICVLAQCLIIYIGNDTILL